MSLNYLLILLIEREHAIAIVREFTSHVISFNLSKMSALSHDIDMSVLCEKRKRCYCLRKIRKWEPPESKMLIQNIECRTFLLLTHVEFV